MHISAIECRVELSGRLVRVELVQIIIVPRPDRPIEILLVDVRR
jgi:hypothetical protein